MEDEVLDAPDETTSEDAPDEEAETTSESGDEPEPSTEEGDDETEDEPKEAAAPTPSAWKNFEKKFLHIKDPEARQEAMAEAWWEKNNFASRTFKEKQALERKLADLEKTLKQTPPEPEKPGPPPQELVELDSRIQELYQQDQALIKETEQALVGLNAVDTEIAKLQGKLEDAKETGDDTKQTRLEAALQAKAVQREGVLRDYKTSLRERKALAREYEKVGKERIWLETVLKDKASRQAQEKQEAEEFKSDFPEQVDRLVESAAAKFNIPAHLLEELQQETNDGLMVDLWKLGEANLDDVDLPGLIRQRVEKFARTRNLAERRKFADTSKEKLKVAGRARVPAPPGAPGKPVSPASMISGDSTPKMKKGRDYLVSRGF